MSGDNRSQPSTEHTPTPWRSCPYSQDIYADDVPKGPMRVADIRGWGYLTGKGHGALGLSDEEAMAIQKANAAFIVEAVNSHAALVKALEHFVNCYNITHAYWSSSELQHALEEARAALSHRSAKT